jgi:hypothetical protein
MRTAIPGALDTDITFKKNETEYLPKDTIRIQEN